MDPLWISVAFSALAAALAALAALRPRYVEAPLSMALSGAFEGLQQDLSRLQASFAEDMRRAREEGGTQSRGLREELQVNLDRLTVSLGATLDRLGGVQAEKLLARWPPR